MNFEKFKNITPDNTSKNRVLQSVDLTDTDYIFNIASLKTKSPQKRKWFIVLGETAAAIAIVVAVALWAILGRGIQIDNPVSSSHSERGIYHVMVDTKTGTVLNGKKDLQKFFDDFANGKECTVELFVTDGTVVSDVNKYVGYTKTFYIDETGKTVVYFDSDGVPYYDNAVFGTFDFAYLYKEISVLRFAFIQSVEKWYLQCDDICIVFDADAIENTHENSERVYDSSKSQPVLIENYTVKSGEQSLKDFFEHYYKGYATSVDINGKPFYYDGSELYTVNNGVSKELSKLEYVTTTHTFDVVEDTVPDSINIQPLTITAMSSSNIITVKALSTVILELYREEFISLNLAHNTKNITVYQADNFVTITRDRNNATIETLITALKNNPKEQYKTYLGGDCDYSLELNENFSLSLFITSDGTISNMIGLNYIDNTAPVAIKANDELLTALEDVIALVPQSVQINDDIEKTLVSVSNEYRFDYLPDFNDKNELSFEDVINYAFAMDGFPSRLQAVRLNFTTGLMLDTTFDVADDYYVPMSVEGCADYGSDVKKLVKAEQFMIGNDKAVTVEFDIYLSAEEQYPYRIQKTTYIVTDGYTPVRIISNLNGSVREDGKRIFNTSGFNPGYDKRWQYLREAIDEYYKTEGKFEAYMLRNLKFYSTPDEDGIFSFQFIGDIKPKPEFAAQYGIADEDGWMGTYWETLWFKETADGITCIGSGDTMPTIEDELADNTEVFLQYQGNDAIYPKYYTLRSEDSKAILDILEGFTYDGDLCKCDPPYKVYIDDYKEYTYSIDLNSDTPHIKAFGAQHEMTEAEADSLRDIIYRYYNANAA